MLNQSFTADNFRKIFDYENRKGQYLEGLFFPEIEELTKKIKGCASEIKDLRRRRSLMSQEKFDSEIKKICDKKDSP